MSLYSNISSIVVNIIPFKVERSVRQGCPLSHVLYILAVELLAINFSKNGQISGIKPGDTEITISQLACDTICFLKDVYSVSIDFC